MKIQYYKCKIYRNKLISKNKKKYNYNRNSKFLKKMMLWLKIVKNIKLLK